MLELTGRYDGGRFNDTAAVLSSARTGAIACAAQTSADVHCTGGGFVSSASGSGLLLHAREHTGREFANMYAAYRLQ